MKNFALMGIGGFIAPRHLKAIKNTNNLLLAAYDKSDSVGIIDNYFPNAAFFTEMELFDRHCSKLLRNHQNIDYLSICTPNYLHDAHIRYGLRLGANVICEKPLVLNPWNIDALQQIEEKEAEGKVYNILQLRLHPAIIALKRKIEQAPKGKMYNIDLTYITSRGNWYYASWKGDERKSGGVATNIGIHFYDMLIWIFGNVKKNIVHVRSHDRVAGYLELERAYVRYFLSISAEHLPQKAIEQGKKTYRILEIDEHEFDFSEGFTELHTKSYEEILAGRGFGLAETRSCIELVYQIRNTQIIGLQGDYHPLAVLPHVPHPILSSFKSENI
jgi:UDP-N-acetyl-2-amino-2-deoxyglucuronate dehydrogenase